MRKIKIAQIGFNLNSHSIQICDSLKKQSDIFDFVGYVLPENERARIPHRVAHGEGLKELTLQEVLENPEIEAVAIETDEIYLTKYALMAAEHKKHIHMEKPGGREIKQFEKLIQIVKKNNTVFHTGYMYRYNPAVIEVLQKVKNGDLGEIVSVEAQMNCIHNVQNRQWLSDLPGGMMFFLGCHLIDLILQIQGLPKNIIPLNRSTGLDGVTSDDFGFAILEYENGVSFAKTIATELGGFQRRQLVVTGSKGTIELRPLEEKLEHTILHTPQYEYTTEGWHDAPIVKDSVPYDRYDDMLASFAAMVRGEKKNPYTPDYELELYKTVLKCCGMK